MGKIVIPKHSAIMDEINAVLKIHYEERDWVAGRDFKRKLMALIGSEQYPSSYPKKAQVPAYFGFIESHVVGTRITERRITDTGIEMYEAILSDDLATRQRLIMDALENVIFGKNNGGCTSSNSEIEAPNLFIRCVIDTGYCTTSEYAYLVWSLNDQGKKYYETLSEIISARSAGGIAIPSEASDYKDWKPILAMLRWGFLEKSDDGQQKLMLRLDVISKYADRLEKLKVYNIDKNGTENEESLDDIEIDSSDSSVLKPFKADEEIINQLHTGSITSDSTSVEKQNIYAGDNVLFVDRNISHLLTYYSYSITAMNRVPEGYTIKLTRQYPINRTATAVLIEDLRKEDKKQNEAVLSKCIKEVFSYSKAKENMNSLGSAGQDIEPANAIIRITNSLGYLTQDEQSYALYSLIEGHMNYEEVVEDIKNNRLNGVPYTNTSIMKYAHSVPIEYLINTGFLEGKVNQKGNTIYSINCDISEKYPNRLQHLMFYAVDIAHKIDEKEPAPISLPQVIKPIVINNHIVEEKTILLAIDNKQMSEKKLVQGDYVVFVNEGKSVLFSSFVYQIHKIELDSNKHRVTFVQRHIINAEYVSEILCAFKGR